MQIGLNKDFEKEYPSTGIKGFNMRESIAIFLALGAMGGLGYLLWLHTDLEYAHIVYAVLPVGAIIVFAICYRYQGELSLLELLRAMAWERKTKVLYYSAEEFDMKQTRVFSMTRKTKKKGGRRIK